MAISTQYVTLDVTKDRLPAIVRIGQGDMNGTQLVATILDDGEPFSLTGYSVRFAMRLPNNYAHYSVDGTVSGNVATFTIDEAYAASVAGHTDVAYVEILQGDTVICSTSRMNVICLQSAYEGVDPAHIWDNGVEEFLDNAQAEVNAAVASAESAAADARSAISDIQIVSTTVESTTPVTVNDAWPTTPKSGLVYGKSVQSGTPAPSAPVEVQVVRECNLLPQTSISYTGSGVTFTRNEDGSVTASIGATAAQCQMQFQFTADFSGNCMYSGCPAGGGINTYDVYMWDMDTGALPKKWNGTSAVESDTGSGAQVKITKGTIYKLILRTMAGYTGNDVTFYPKIEINSTVSPYVPYGCVGLQIGETVVPIDLQGNVLASLPDGTRDVLRVDSAGHVTIEKNVGTFKPDNTIAVAGIRAPSGSATAYRFVLSLPTDAKAITSANALKFASNRFTPNSDASSTADKQANGIAAYYQYSGNPSVLLCLDGVTNADDLRTWLGNNETVFTYALNASTTIDLGTITLPELANPCELAFYASLDPTWAITYERDPNVINSSIESSIAPIEGVTASANYAVGSYLMHGSKLYKVTSAIATGETITPGTNCTQTTVMAEIMALA